MISNRFPMYIHFNHQKHKILQNIIIFNLLEWYARLDSNQGPSD